MVRPIDDILDRPSHTGNAVYGLHPWPVLEHIVATTIHDPAAVEARRARQRRVEATLQRGELSGLGRRAESLRKGLARRAAERRQRAEDEAIGARVKGFLDAAEVGSFRAKRLRDIKAPHLQSA